jgi:hypothetical protein
VPGTIPRVSIVADSAEATGLKWAAPAGGAGLTLIDEIPFTSTSTINADSIFSSTYKNYRLMLVWKNVADNQAIGVTVKMRASGSSTSSGYESLQTYAYQNAIASRYNYAGTDEWYGFDASGNNRGNACAVMDLLYPYESSYTNIQVSANNQVEATGNILWSYMNGVLTNTTVYDGISIIAPLNVTGTLFVYGYAKE